MYFLRFHPVISVLLDNKRCLCAFVSVCSTVACFSSVVFLVLCQKLSYILTSTFQIVTEQIREQIENFPREILYVYNTIAFGMVLRTLLKRNIIVGITLLLFSVIIWQHFCA